MFLWIFLSGMQNAKYLDSIRHLINHYVVRMYNDFPGAGRSTFTVEMGMNGE